MKKYISILIIFSLLFGISGCSVSNDDSKVDPSADSLNITQTLSPKPASYVEEGTPWYTSDEIQYWDHNDGGSKTLVDYTYPYKIMQYTNSSGTYHCIEIYEWDSLEHIDIQLNMNTFADSCFVYNDNLYVVSTEYLGEDTSNSILMVDTENCILVDYLDPDLRIPNAHDIRIEKVKSCNDLFYIQYSYYVDYATEYGFMIITPDGHRLSQFSVPGQINSWSIDSNGNIVCITYGGILRIDPNTEIIERVEVEGNIRDRYANVEILDDCCSYITDTNALNITRFNYNTMEEEVVIDINNCDIDFSKLFYNSFIYGDGDNYILKRTSASSFDELLDIVVIELHRASVNPHIGKQILTAAIPNYNVLYYFEGIHSFNNTNDEFFIQLISDYLPSDDELSNDYFNAELRIINQLKRDIMNGIGPDILLGFGQFPLLNYEDYLVNEIPLLDGENGINRDEYFNNVFQAFTNNGELYQVPLSVNVAGLYVDNDYVNISGTGFSYEEYENHVSGVWNGEDPFQTRYTSSYYLQCAMNTYYEIFHDQDGLLHIDNEEFRAIAEYAATLPQVFSEYDTDIQPVAEYSEFASFRTDIKTFSVLDNYSFYGMPSLGESSPSVEMLYSAAITTCTSSIAGSWALVKHLLSYDVQRRTTGMNPINVSAWEEAARLFVDDVNGSVFYSGRVAYDYSIIATYEAYLRSATTGAQTDVVMMTIIMEEMQPYFQGDKCIDDIIPVVEDRVNIMINENR